MRACRAVSTLKGARGDPGADEQGRKCSKSALNGAPGDPGAGGEYWNAWNVGGDPSAFVDDGGSGVFCLVKGDFVFGNATLEIAQGDGDSAHGGLEADWQIGGLGDY